MKFAEIKSQIDKLTKIYGYEFKHNAIFADFDIMMLQLNMKKTFPPKGKNKQMAEFIQFLRSCKGSTLKIQGTIQNPKRGQVKYSNITIDIDDEYILFYIHLLLNAILYCNQEGLFQYEFNWKDKRPLLFEETNGFFVEAYTDDELEKIIEYEKIEEFGHSYTGNAILGRRLEFVYRKLLKEDKTFGKSKVKDYSYLYDCYVILGKFNDIEEGFSGDIGKEKYQKVRDHIKAYQTQLKKKKLSKIGALICEKKEREIAKFKQKGFNVDGIRNEFCDEETTLGKK